MTRFTTPSYADTGRAYDSLNTYAFPGRRNLGYLFAFESKRQKVMASVKVDEATGQQTITISPTRKRFDAMIEFPRLLSKTTTTQSPWILWASLNSTYQLSPTYPSVMVGPATLDETKPDVQNIVKQCAAFRSEQRLPCLTWCGTGGASIWRSSQPKIGLQGNRSPADELFLRHVVESARSANAMAEPPPSYSRTVLRQLTGDYTKDWTPEPACGLKILDLRPRSAAMANRTGGKKMLFRHLRLGILHVCVAYTIDLHLTQHAFFTLPGYGYENTSNYSNTTLQFCNIGNIHAVRDSYQKLCTVCNSDATADIQWNSLVEDTKWLSHIRIILAAAWETAYWVHVWRMPILVHCSHGWDRTSQVCALAQLLLDPYYRTVEGFSCLVEKDFMSFGHPFHTRCAHGEGRGNDSSNSTSIDEGQISPIFLQFLDCVYQIVQLFPECFEFTTAYLLELSFQVYSCRFGSLLCDTERERELLAGIRQRTYSLWDYLDDQPDLRNSHYTNTEGVLLMPLPTLMRNVTLWVDRHCRYGPKPTWRKAVLDASS
jgi:myotubularin-related protein 1/2